MTQKVINNPDAKFNQSVTVIIKRSQINFSPYNPKHHTKEHINDIKRNFKRVGFLGGIIWNSVTGNLVDGHKRVMVHDLYYKYDGTPETDYDIKVEKIELDQKTEKEQNIFQYKSATPLDDELMRELISEIDYKNAGLDDFDLNYYGVTVPELENNSIADEIENLYQPIAEQKSIERELSDEEKKQAVKDVKKEIQERAIEKTQDMISYVTLSFDNHQSKVAFCKRFDIPDYSTIIKGEEFSNKVERIYD